MTDHYTNKKFNQMYEYQKALKKLDELEDELMLCDYTDHRRYEIDRQITQTEAWIEDFFVTQQLT